MIENFSEVQAIIVSNEIKENFIGPLKANISLTEFKLFNHDMRKKLKRLHKDDDLKLIGELNCLNIWSYIDEELEENQRINHTYSENDILNGTEIKIDYIKVCIRRHKIIVFDSVISDEDWRSLNKYLKIKENKIIGLDFRNAGFDNYFIAFMYKMRDPNLHCYIRYLKLGVCDLDSMHLTKLANFFLTYYSQTQRSMPHNMFQYL